LKLLVVDDVPVYLFLMKTGIEKVNPFVKIEQASNLNEAIDRLSQGSYHAVISDWNMPGGGGAELLKWMRQRVHFKSVPFIMISGNRHNEDIIRAFMELGVDAYVVKPFRHDDLYEKIVSAIAKRAK
jgi:CheY-like chemotaxis protein